MAMEANSRAGVICVKVVAHMARCLRMANEVLLRYWMKTGESMRHQALEYEKETTFMDTDMLDNAAILS